MAALFMCLGFVLYCPKMASETKDLFLQCDNLWHGVVCVETV